MLNHLAIDAGGTSSRAVLLAPDGSCLGYGTSGGGNPVSRGIEAATEALMAATGEALGGVRQPFGSVTLCMAGGSLKMPTHLFREGFEAWGLTGTLVLETDLLATFYSGSYHSNGYALIAGTGAVGLRVQDSELAAVVDGAGWLLGDNGSGFWLGRETIRAVSAALDGRGPQTSLTDLLLAGLDIKHDAAPTPTGRSGAQQQLIAQTYAMAPIEISRFAPLLFEDANDAVSVRIIDQASTELALTLGAAMLDADQRSERHAATDYPLVFGGSVLTKGSTVANAVLAKLPEGLRGTHAPAPVLVHDGAVGAAVLALKRQGIEVDQVKFDRITRSLAQLRRP